LGEKGRRPHCSRVDEAVDPTFADAHQVVTRWQHSQRQANGAMKIAPESTWSAKMSGLSVADPVSISITRARAAGHPGGSVHLGMQRRQ